MAVGEEDLDVGGAMSKTIDFISYHGWGHATHGSTMREIKMPKRGLFKDFHQSLKDKKEKARYRSMMQIVGVDQCSDPRDMYTLEFRVVP